VPQFVDQNFEEPEFVFVSFAPSDNYQNQFSHPLESENIESESSGNFQNDLENSGNYKGDLERSDTFQTFVHGPVNLCHQSNKKVS
jgi:hypothetical protein